jgi:hypothetical protein
VESRIEDDALRGFIYRKCWFTLVTKVLTIFSTPKPFVGHAAIIQRNALHSWKLLQPDVEVILFGDDAGAAEVCRDLGIRHEPDVRRNENGTKYLNYIFDRAHEISQNKCLCYVNCDIMLMSDFRESLEIISKAHNEFLMIGRRWDTNVTKHWNFGESTWESRLKSLALIEGRQNSPSWIDYFCFSRELYYGKMPPFLIGRHGWDPWLTWFARKSGVPLIDASRAVLAVHQNHDYAYLKKGLLAQISPTEENYNVTLGGASGQIYYTTEAATEIIAEGALKVHRTAWLGPVKTRLIVYGYKIWWTCLGLTRPIRHRLGWRKKALEQSS